MNSEKFFGCLGEVLASTAIGVVDVALSGWGLTVMWRWLVTPVFALPGLSIIEAFGIILIVRFITEQESSCKKEDESVSEIITRSSVRAVLRAPIAVGIGWLILQFK